MRKQFERFCYKHRNKGIPNLMLYISLGCAVTYAFTLFSDNMVLFNLLSFDRTAIFQGQIWRLFTYPLVFSNGNILTTAISLVCYYSLGRSIENLWGTFRFNLFYFSGVIMMDIYCMIFGGSANTYYLNTSLFLAYATIYPNAQFLFMYIIPVRAWIFAVIDLVLVVYGLVVYPFPQNLFSVISLANYFLFFGKDVLNLVPVSWRINAQRLLRRKGAKGTGREKPKPVPFPSAGSYEATVATVKPPYTHKCTVCGRTDISNPELEFRYCSRCSGYHCYCQDHISSHTHIV